MSDESGTPSAAQRPVPFVQTWLEDAGRSAGLNPSVVAVVADLTDNDRIDGSQLAERLAEIEEEPHAG